VISYIAAGMSLRSLHGYRYMIELSHDKHYLYIHSNSDLPQAMHAHPAA